jgi:hypothetical protein
MSLAYLANPLSSTIFNTNQTLDTTTRAAPRRESDSGVAAWPAHCWPRRSRRPPRSRRDEPRRRRRDNVAGTTSIANTYTGEHSAHRQPGLRSEHQHPPAIPGQWSTADVLGAYKTALEGKGWSVTVASSGGWGGAGGATYTATRATPTACSAEEAPIAPPTSMPAHGRQSPRTATVVAATDDSGDDSLTQVHDIQGRPARPAPFNLQRARRCWLGTVNPWVAS